MNINRIFGLILINIALVSCIIFPGCSGSNNDYESFLTGNGKLLYFIKPTDFNGDAADATIDISFQAFDTATGFCNFTINNKNDQPFKVINSQFTKDGKNAVTLFDVDRLFKEGDKSRFTGKFKYAEFKNLFNSKKIYFVIETDSHNIYKFEAGENFYKILSNLSKDI
jgi:hypothetical protein